MTKNLNYLFNKEYYTIINTLEFTHKHFGQCNEEIINCQFEVGHEIIPYLKHKFILKTAYPGLLFGIGNVHEAGNNLVSGEEKDGAEIKLGFTLDYVTGLPVIPGSTVKGVLRSAFKNSPEYIYELIKSLNKDGKEYNLNEIEEIEKEVFGNPDMGKCIFFDAFPVNPGKDKRIFGLDNITPHKDDLKNPIPLTMLKIIPNVSFLFRFEVRENGKLEANILIDLFKGILIDLGIGAKTNVGFGLLLQDEKKIESYKMLEPKKAEKTNVNNQVHSAGIKKEINNDSKRNLKPERNTEEKPTENNIVLYRRGERK
ncbi:MAG: type III-B CRISPR module RAMP protein Cmr6 [Fusobacteriaceae bacterium]|jgi:CRISPR-associated protein Cmr6|nr:type III-B CRISPR module RAMP protein Cmr6 [Fusobacteriaceae bacterium]